MSLSTSTVRALAASVAIVAAGVVFAGAAAFHLPVLGFAQPARAAAASPPARLAVVRRAKPKPVRIVRTRYVTDVVHRPAPVSAPALVAAAQYATPAAAAPAVAAYVPPARPRLVVSPRPTVPTAYHDGANTEHDGSDDGGGPTQHTNTPSHPAVGGDS